MFFSWILNRIEGVVKMRNQEEKGCVEDKQHKHHEEGKIKLYFILMTKQTRKK